MKRAAYQLSIDYVLLEDIHCVLWEFFTQEEAKELNKKSNDLLSCLSYRDSESRALAEKVFAMGYIAAHINYPENTNENT